METFLNCYDCLAQSNFTQGCEGVVQLQLGRQSVSMCRKAAIEIYENDVNAFKGMEVVNGGHIPVDPDQIYGPEDYKLNTAFCRSVEDFIEQPDAVIVDLRPKLVTSNS